MRLHLASALSTVLIKRRYEADFLGSSDRSPCFRGANVAFDSRLDINDDGRSLNTQDTFLEKIRLVDYFGHHLHCDVYGGICGAQTLS